VLDRALASARLRWLRRTASARLYGSVRRSVNRKYGGQ